MMKSFRKKNSACLNREARRGFTLIEAMVAISIFTVSILGLMSVLSRGLSDTGYAKRKVIASYLAQEGIEYMRNLRDTYVINFDPNDPTAGWNAFKVKIGANNNTLCANTNNFGCYFTIDPPPIGSMNTLTPQSCTSSDGRCTNAAAHILYHSITGKYNYTGGADATDSGFTRSIRVTVISNPNIPNSNELKISSTVYWTQGSGIYQLAFSENLLNWKE